MDKLGKIAAEEQNKLVESAAKTGKTGSVFFAVTSLAVDPRGISLSVHVSDKVIGWW